jgi:uncharacterized membrane protein YeaQ/YmgE (transglycosylase-associated protein family)
MIGRRYHQGPATERTWFSMAQVTLSALSFSLDPVSILVWLVIGLIAGFLASRVMRGGGYGLIGDIVVGLIGALLGGFLASLLGFGSYGLLGSIIVAFIGACVLIAVLRAVSRRGRFL